MCSRVQRVSDLPIHGVLGSPCGDSMPKPAGSASAAEGTKGTLAHIYALTEHMRHMHLGINRPASPGADQRKQGRSGLQGGRALGDQHQLPRLRAGQERLEQKTVRRRSNRLCVHAKEGTRGSNAAPSWSGHRGIAWV